MIYVRLTQDARSQQLHRFYDHKIELIDEEILSWSRLYQMFDHKLQKIKKYLINHLNKEFIFFSFASYVSLILFVKKKDDSLRFLRWLQKAQCFNQTKSLLFVIDRQDFRLYTRKQVSDSIEHHYCVQQTTHALR